MSDGQRTNRGRTARATCLAAAILAMQVAWESQSLARSAEAAAQAGAAAGTAKGFVRVNGASVTLAHAVAVTAPDSFDPSKPVQLVLVTPMPLPRAAVEKAASRGDVFGLVAQGAIVEIRASGHDVVIIHKALGKDSLRTGGQSDFDTTNPARAKGSVQPFMSGDSELFGFKARYETVFDAPIVKLGKPRDVTARMVMDAGFPLAKWRTSLLEQVDGEGERLIASLSGGTAAALRAPAVAPPSRSSGATRTTAAAIDWKAPGPYPARSKAEAAKLLAKPGADNDPTEHMFDALRDAEPHRLALAIQAGADVRVVREGSQMGPLHYLAWQCDGRTNPAQQLSMVEQLLEAGADVSALDVSMETPLIAAADDCSLAMVKALIAAGSPLTAAGTTGSTTLKTAIVKGRADVVEALIDAGVDPRKEPYNANRLASGNKAVEAALKRRRR